MRALVTGFEPFGGAEVNPSQLLVEALAAEPPRGSDLATAVLPVSYGRAAAELARAVADADPDLVVCFGLARTRTEISVERFAHNLHDETDPDNDGAVPSGEIDPDGPVAYGSGLPVDAIVAALGAEGIPAGASRDAGGYVCNRVFYSLLGLLERERPEASGGFVHVPPLEAVPLATLVRATGIILLHAR